MEREREMPCVCVFVFVYNIKNMVDAKFEVERRLREGEWDLSLQRKKATHESEF